MADVNDIQNAISDRISNDISKSVSDLANTITTAKVPITVKNPADITGLQTMLSNLLKITTKDFEKINDDLAEDLGKTLNEGNKQVTNAIKEGTKATKSALDSSLSDSSKGMSKLARAINIASVGLSALGSMTAKVLDQSIQITNHYNELASKLRNAGISVYKSGEDFTTTFNNAATQLGIDTESLSNVMTKNSELLLQVGSRTNKSAIDLINNGLKDYRNTKETSDISANMMAEAMKLQLQTMKNGMTKEELRTFNLDNATTKLAKHMSDLSLMTGKSVEQISKELEVRETRNLYDVFQNQNKGMVANLNALNLPQFMKDFIATGKTSNELAGALANNENGAELIYRLREARLNGTLESKDFFKNNPQILNLIQSTISEAVKTSRAIGDMGNASSEWQQMMLAFMNMSGIDINALKKYNESGKIAGGQGNRNEQNKELEIIRNDIKNIEDSIFAFKGEVFNGFMTAEKTKETFKKDVLTTINKWDISGKLDTLIGWVSGISSIVGTIATINAINSVTGGLLTKGSKAGIGKVGNLIKNGLKTSKSVAGKVVGTTGEVLTDVGTKAPGMMKNITPLAKSGGKLLLKGAGIAAGATGAVYSGGKLLAGLNAFGWDSNKLYDTKMNQYNNESIYKNMLGMAIDPASFGYHAEALAKKMINSSSNFGMNLANKDFKKEFGMDHDEYIKTRDAHWKQLNQTYAQFLKQKDEMEKKAKDLGWTEDHKLSAKEYIENYEPLPIPQKETSTPITSGINEIKLLNDTINSLIDIFKSGIHIESGKLVIDDGFGRLDMTTEVLKR